MSAVLQQQSKPFTKSEARTYKKNYQQVSHIINRLFNRLCVDRDEKTARAIGKAAAIATKLHGMMNGQDLPFFRAHKWTARQFNYAGTDENAAKFMGRRFADLKTAEKIVGRKFFEISAGGTDEQLITGYERDYIGEAAEWVLLQVKNSPGYARHPAAAVTDEILDEAIGKLPEVKKDPNAEFDAETTEGADLADEWIIKGQWTKIHSQVEKNLIRELESGSDPVLKAQREAAKIISIARHLKERYTREKLNALSSLGEEVIEERECGNNTQDTFEPAASDLTYELDPQEEAADLLPPDINVQGLDSQDIEPEHVTASPVEEIAENDLLFQALHLASQGIKVFPLHGVFDGICSCKAGTDCKSAGKHPRTVNGLKDASANPDVIRRWWEKWPYANVGMCTGGQNRILAVDVDPKNGGDASLTDLIEVYGTDWLDTSRVRTGSGGTHLFFRYPESVDLRNTAGKLGPGIDTRAEGGYVVAAPSTHASGGVYEIAEDKYAALAPDWMLERLTLAPDQQPAVVIDFQEHRERAHFGTGAIVEGERNRRLFEVGCAIWGHGQATDLPDLHAQLSEINSQRCNPALDGSELAKIASSITARYQRGTENAGPTAA